MNSGSSPARCVFPKAIEALTRRVPAGPACMPAARASMAPASSVMRSACWKIARPASVRPSFRVERFRSLVCSVFSSRATALLTFAFVLPMRRAASENEPVSTTRTKVQMSG
ncbi:MAG: hypothetical protein V7631_2861 [Massilia sp.]